MSETIKNSLRALLADSVDYAGLFPPSKVSMSQAVRNYAQYLKSDNAWMLGRFVLPAANLEKFLKEFEEVFTDGDPWRLSVIIAEDEVRNLRKAARFNEKNAGRAVVETVEIKASSPEMLRQTANEIPAGLTCYFEVPSSIILTDLVTALALSRTRAKIRTGGTIAEDFPPVDNIVKFMRICTAANIPFKATAGLHHPLRCVKPLTYEENSVRGTMNGFLNLFLTAIFLRQNMNHQFVHDLMNETNPGNFEFTDESVSWKNQTVSVAEIELARRRSIISFGSCSFLEPIEDLQSIGLL